MKLEQWTAVDDYFTSHLVAADPALEDALAAGDAAGMPAINVAPNQGKLLYLLAKLQGARRVLEIGTLGGYSTIWMARALPKDGRLISLEFNADYAKVAQAIIKRAGLADVVEIRIGAAIDSLPVLAIENQPPFDLVFIDADKANNAAYLDWALKLTRPGSVIICDNVVRNGAVTDPASTDPSVIGTRHLVERLAEEPRLSATALQTVGSKGYDGFVIALVLE